LERPIRFSRVLAERPKLALSLGANGVMASIGAGLALQLLPVASSVSARASVASVRSPLGASALGRRPRESEAGKPRASYPHVSPPPDRAPSDVSRGHDRCQLSDFETRSPPCEIGSPTGSIRAVVVGDSKASQYYDAFDEVGKALDWRISTMTKGACPFADVMVEHKGRLFEPCREFYLHTLEALRAHPPDLIITSQASNRGFVPGGRTEATTEAMVDGLVRTWTEVLSWGTKLAVIVDHPSPDALRPTPECLLANPRESEKCAFDRDAGTIPSAAGVQRAASARVPGARLIDLTDFICPQPRCAPVIGDVVVYRDGRHLTNTYARSLAPMLTAKLAVAAADEPRWR
jgi:hypothetical protein